MRKLPLTAAEDLLEIVMRRYQRASTLVTSNRPVDDWGKLLGDTAAVTAMLDRLLHHGHVLKCGPRSWRTKIGANEHGLVDLTSTGVFIRERTDLSKNWTLLPTRPDVARRTLPFRVGKKSGECPVKE